MKFTEIITTHTNADYDGIASLAAAKKLYPNAYVLFPGTSEQGALQILEKLVDNIIFQENLKKINLKEIKRLILVDTRNPKRLAGLEEFILKNKPEIHIYDHHPEQIGDIIPDVLIFKETGSTTTILVEKLIEKGITLSSDEATLLMAGIYEDTGWLSYSSTKPEDFKACSWLLQSGARLEEVRSLISRDMSRVQIKLLNEMLESLKKYSIYEIEVAITSATSEEYVGDFAVLVQKVKDMENLSVIFGIGRFGDKIYLVGRSRTPDVNVGEILSIFGGGGHAYAASANLKDFTIFQVEEMLISELKKKIQKPKVARDIMSLPVKYVFPETTVEDAKDVLTRYNINMVPVCEENAGKLKIVGLISRQNVEKASFHGYGGNEVKDFMTTEFFSVRPEATIKEIQELIFRGRQRLLPVVNEDDEPVGVITRTDFLRIVQDEQIREEKISGEREEFSKNLKKLMKEFLDEDTLERLISIGEVASDMGYNAYLLGGIVRDMLLRRKNYDVDIVVEGDGLKLAHKIASLLKAKITEHKKFGTAQLTFEDGKKIDIATARVEYYPSPGSLPTVEKGSLKLDLYRRDFTINTLAVKLNPENFGELIDFFGGVRDLKDGIIRVLHNLSFVEDPTRVFRAIRFEVRFNFKISKHALYLIKNAVKMNVFELLSGNRLFTELELILKEEDPSKIFDRISELSVMECIYRGLDWKMIKPVFLRAQDVIKWYELLYTGSSVSKEIVLFLALFNDFSFQQIKQIVTKFGIVGLFAKKILVAKEKENSVNEILRNASDASDVYFALKDIPPEVVLYYMAKSDNDNVRKNISLFFKKLINIELSINGNDLIALGYKPSNLFSEVMKRLIKERINGRVKTKEDEINFVKNHFPLR